MTVRRADLDDNSSIRLTGWKLVAALALMTVVILGTLWLTGSPKAAIIVTFPLLMGLGVITIRRE
jgi:hypothetical protein